MGKVNFSVVTTVLNEADSICPLIDSLISQSYQPAEIIVIDAGSSDQTVGLIQDKAEQSPIPIRCYYCPGFNRSQGRNEGIRLAQHAYIAVTDAGCEADKDWLKQLAKEFSSDIEAVGGFYLPKINHPLQRIFSEFTCVSPADFDKRVFLASSRSIAFTRAIWKKVSGYPEHLETCEDLIFARRLQQTGRMTATHLAIVYWRQPDGMGAYFSQIVGYARGDVEAVYWPHLRKIIGVWLRYICFLLLPPLFLMYAAYVVWKYRSMTAIGVQAVTDWAVLTGSLQGVWRKRWQHENS